MYFFIFFIFINKFISLIMAFIPYHQHLIVKGYCNNPFVSSENLNKWFIDLVHNVDMEVVAGPTSVYVDEEGNEGITGTVTLATSHSSIHIWDQQKPSLFQFDIYSCKIFDKQIVFDHLNIMDLENFEWISIDRNNNLYITESGIGYKNTHKKN